MLSSLAAPPLPSAPLARAVQKRGDDLPLGGSLLPGAANNPLVPPRQEVAQMPSMTLQTIPESAVSIPGGVVVTLARSKLLSTSHLRSARRIAPYMRTLRSET